MSEPSRTESSDDETTNGSTAHHEPATHKKPTVQEMIKLLWEDGFYRGIVGWVNDGPTEGPFFDEPPPKKFIDFKPGPDRVEQLELGNFDMTIIMQEADEYDAHEKHVKKMVRKHKELIPAAIRVIDHILVKAGVPEEEIDKLTTTGTASEAYAKLNRIEEAQRPFIPERIRFRIICDFPGRLWETYDLHLKPGCTLEDLTDAILWHGLIDYDSDKQNGLDGKALMYKIVSDDKKIPSVAPNVDAWTVIEDEDDFQKLKEKQKEYSTAVAAICHETVHEKLDQNLKEGRGLLPREPEFEIPDVVDEVLAEAMDRLIEKCEEKN